MDIVVDVSLSTLKATCYRLVIGRSFLFFKRCGNEETDGREESDGWKTERRMPHFKGGGDWIRVVGSRVRRGFDR